MTSTPPPTPAGDDPTSQPTPVTARGAFSAAVRSAGIGQVAPGEMPTAASLLSAVGGFRGLAEAILPALGFLVIWAVTKNLAASVLIPVAIAAVFVIVRLASRTPITQAFAGIAGVAVSAGFALFTGRPEDNFVPGIVINVVSLLVLLVSLGVRYPFIGLVVGVLSNDGVAWRANAAKRRVLTITTWLWVGLFATRLIVEYPLFLAGEVELLGTAKLILGVPFYAIVLWITWLMVRSVYGRENAAAPRE